MPSRQAPGQQGPSLSFCVQGKTFLPLNSVHPEQVRRVTGPGGGELHLQVEAYEEQLGIEGSVLPGPGCLSHLFP